MLAYHVESDQERRQSFELGDARVLAREQGVQVMLLVLGAPEIGELLRQLEEVADPSEHVAALGLLQRFASLLCPVIDQFDPGPHIRRQDRYDVHLQLSLQLKHELLLLADEKLQLRPLLLEVPQVVRNVVVLPEVLEVEQHRAHLLLYY